MANAYGVEYRWPLLDTRLIEQYLFTPSIEKRGPSGVGRYLHRRAISDWVPHEVAWKIGKDMGHVGMVEKMQKHCLPIILKQAREEIGDLHPELDALIDSKRWRQQINQVEQGPLSIKRYLHFRKQALAIMWLNRWLHRDDAIS